MDSEKQSSLNKMMLKILGTKTFIDEIVPLVNIGKDFLEFENGTKIHMFKRELMQNFDVLHGNEFFDKSFALSKYIDKMKDGDSIGLYIKIDNFDYGYTKFMTNEKASSNKFITEFKRNKYEQTKNHKHITVYAGIRGDSLNQSNKILLEKMKFVPMNSIEHFSFIYDHMNPDKRKNDLNTPPPSQLMKKLNSDSVSILRLIYDSYIEDSSSGFFIGEHKLKNYEVIMPPHNMNINGLIKDVVKLKSNSLITINFIKNNNYLAKLRKKRKFAKGSLLSFLNAINSSIDQNITKLEEFVIENHSSMTECSVSITLYNKNHSELDKDELVFNAWDGAVAMYNRLDAVKSYMNLPAYSRRYKDSFILSSTHQAHLINVTSYSKNISPSIFFDKNNIINRYDFHDKRKLVNSCLISAPSGRGKSVLLNYIYTQYHILFDGAMNSFILDYGGSYGPLIAEMNNYLTEENQVVYKKLSVDSAEIYNIFDLEFGREITDLMIRQKVAVLIHFFKMAFKGELRNQDETLLDISLYEMYKKFIFDDDYKKMDDDREYFFLENYMNSGMKSVDNFINAMPTFADLSYIMSSTDSIRNSFETEIVLKMNNMLSNFSRNTRTSSFLGKSTSLISNKNLVVDIKEIIAVDSSGYLASLYFAYFASSKYVSFINPEIKKERKMFIVDEYPRILKATPEVEDFVEMLLKTGRKEGIDTYLIAQNVSTFKEDFYENIGTFVIFKPNTVKELDKLKDIIGCNDDFIDYANNIESVPGKYSEVLLLSFTGDNIDKSMLKLELNEFDIKHMTI
jgi:hypothetical protein